MRFMPWELLADKQNITKAQYQQQVQQSLDNWLGIRKSSGRPPTPSSVRPPIPRSMPPPERYPTSGGRRGGSGTLQGAAAKMKEQEALQQWLGISRKHQYEYSKALRKGRNSKSKPDKRKYGNTEPSIPHALPQSRHNLLSIAQTLNL